MGKTTSVEWLAQAIYDKMKMKGDGRVFQGILDEALAIHKEEQRLTYEGVAQNLGTSIRESDIPKFEEYYAKTFGGDNE